MNDNTFKIRTYERGVEDETLSCGTGATAVAIASHFVKKTDKKVILLETKGGVLEVSFTYHNKNYTNVFLKGKATRVFNGKISI
jgi:diaminopimelate epimerase